MEKNALQQKLPQFNFNFSEDELGVFVLNSIAYKQDSVTD